MEFLGVVLENGTIQMDPTKVKGVADWKCPETVKDVRAFLGFTRFYLSPARDSRLQVYFKRVLRRVIEEDVQASTSPRLV
jgi:hypothetical protein